MIARGFTPIGKDFPIFLHPQTREEYALARTERKQGRGYRGFVFQATPDVTLEADLARRDLTINAIAQAEDRTLIDPFNGQADLRQGILRHVSAAFAEDPLRVLRVARFAARFGFAVAPETMTLMRAIVASGELATLSPERVWQELAKGLMEASPVRMIEVLRQCGALAALLPEVDAFVGSPATKASRATDVQSPPVGVSRETRERSSLLDALTYAAQAHFPLAVRYAVLVHDPLDEADDASSAGTSGARASAATAEKVSARLRVPADCRDLAVLAARHYPLIRSALELTPAMLLQVLIESDSLRRPQRLHELLEACEAISHDSGGRAGPYPPGTWLLAALDVVRGVDAKSIARHATDKALIAERLRAARQDALAQWKKTAKDARRS